MEYSTRLRLPAISKALIMSSNMRPERKNRKLFSNERSFLMRRLQLIAYGEPSDVIELNPVSEEVQ